MQNLNLSHFDNVTELTSVEMASIDGGSFWKDVGFLIGAIAQGIVVFATEGGRNAGIVVR